MYLTKKTIIQVKQLKFKYHLFRGLISGSLYHQQYFMKFLLMNKKKHGML